MKRILKAMLYAALPLITIIVIPCILVGIVCGLQALGLNEETSLVLTALILAYVSGVFIYYYKD